MEIIITSILLMIFANIIRWADLVDNTTVRTFRDFRKYSNGMFYTYNLVWLFTTFVIFVIFKLF